MGWLFLGRARGGSARTVLSDRLSKDIRKGGYTAGVRVLGETMPRTEIGLVKQWYESVDFIWISEHKGKQNNREIQIKC